jgi:phosphate transport system ATP-binding protein
VEFSGGQQQRLCIARALALNPEVLLCDEPLTGLDPHSAAQVEELLAALGRERCVVAVLHDMGAARRIGNAGAYFEAGRLVETGGIPALLDDPREEATRRFVAGEGVGAE